MAAKDPATRVRAAQAAALTRWGKLGSADDRRAATESGRKAGFERFEREADPRGPANPGRARTGRWQLQRAHMIRMSLKARAVRARKSKAGAK